MIWSDLCWSGLIWSLLVWSLQVWWTPCPGWRRRVFCGSPVITCTSFCRAACPAEESVCGVNSHRYEIPSHSHLRDTPRVISGSGLERQTVQLFMTSVNASVFQGNFFDEFQLEGVSADANEIFLEVSPENLSRALKTAQNAKSVKIKLSKKSCPCLTLAAELVRRNPPNNR